MAYRAYFAMKDSVRAPDGRPMGAVHGYLGMVTRLAADRKPDSIVHVYDHDWRPTARTQLYAGYKADRPEEPRQAHGGGGYRASLPALVAAKCRP